MFNVNEKSSTKDYMLKFAELQKDVSLTIFDKVRFCSKQELIIYIQEKIV